MMDDSTKQNTQARLKRIAGQVGGIERMVEDDRYCIDVLTQIAAVRAALAKVRKILLEAHVQTCVTHAFNGGDPNEQQAKMKELIDVFDRHCNT